MAYEFVTESINTLFNNVGIDFPDAMILMVVCLALIFGYQDHKIGLISLLLMSGGMLVFFFINGIDTSRILALFFLSIIGMAFSVYYSRQTGGVF